MPRTLLLTLLTLLLNACASHTNGLPNHTRTIETIVFTPLCFIYNICPDLEDDAE